MTHINIPQVVMSYPIGAHMKVNYKAFSDLAEHLFKKADKKLKKVHYVSLLCRGSSGAIAASIYYQKIVERYPNLIEVRINHVKKEGENAHSGSHEGLFRWMDIDRKDILYIMVDDFSNTGNTLYAIYNAVYSDIDIIDYTVLKYIYKDVIARMKEKPITKVLIANKL